jgi:hypothetical protein
VVEDAEDDDDDDEGPAMDDDGENEGEDEGGATLDDNKTNKEHDADDADDDADAAPRTIQILDLHSHTPIISYRGRVFEGRWAENSGTEVLFARGGNFPPRGNVGGAAGASKPSGSSSSISSSKAGERKNDLPYLRSLPNGMAMLAASASRIIAKETTLHRRDGRPLGAAAGDDAATNGLSDDESDAPTPGPSSSSTAPFAPRPIPRAPPPLPPPAGPLLSFSADPAALEEYKRTHNIMLHVGTSRRYAARDRQARFLEDLMAIKRKKGEPDEVTVVALPPADKTFKDNADPDSRPRNTANKGSSKKKKKRKAAADVAGAPRKGVDRLGRSEHMRGWVAGPDGVKRRVKRKAPPTPWDDEADAAMAVATGSSSSMGAAAVGVPREESDYYDDDDDDEEMSDDAETDEDEVLVPDDEGNPVARAWDDLSADEGEDDEEVDDVGEDDDDDDDDDEDDFYEDDDDQDDGQRPPPKKARAGNAISAPSRAGDGHLASGPEGGAARKKGRPKGSGKQGPPESG